MSVLGANIRSLRDGKGLTQMQLGEKIGLAESTISLYESGKREPDIDTLLRLADFFGVTTDYLLGRIASKSSITIIAAGRFDSGTDDLPERALKEIEQFIEFVRSKYGKKSNS